jgi:hypothetical protein
MPSPTKTKPKKSKIEAGAAAAAGRILKPKNDTTKGRVLTKREAQDEQEKRTKKRIKGGYQNSTRT